MSKNWKYGDDVNTDMLFPGKYTYACAASAADYPATILADHPLAYYRLEALGTRKSG